MTETPEASCSEVKMKKIAALSLSKYRIESLHKRAEHLMFGHYFPEAVKTLRGRFLA